MALGHTTPWPLTQLHIQSTWPAEDEERKVLLLRPEVSLAFQLIEISCAQPLAKLERVNRPPEPANDNCFSIRRQHRRLRRAKLRLAIKRFNEFTRSLTVFELMFESVLN